MTSIYFTDADGVVVGAASCTQETLHLNTGPAGTTRHFGVAQPFQQRLVDGALIPYTPPKPYWEQRKEAYPEIGDQLDALWKTLQNLPPNLLTDEAQQMLAAIDAVKTQIPKESA